MGDGSDQKQTDLSTQDRKVITLEILKSTFTTDLVDYLYMLSFLIASLGVYYIFSRILGLHYLILVLGLLLSLWLVGKRMSWKKLMIFAILPLSIGICAGICFGLSLVVLLLLIVFLNLVSGFLFFIYTKRENSKNYPRHILPFFKKFVFVIPRILFLNILHLTFPIIVVWTSLIFLITIIFAEWTGITSYEVLQRFVGVLTALGIISGFFQYYVSRHEERVQKKILNYLNNEIFSKIRNEFSYREFIRFLEEESRKLEKSKEDPNRKNDLKNLLDKIKEIESNPRFERIKIFTHLPRLPGKDVHVENIIINQTLSDEIYFRQLEDELKDLKDKDKSDLKERLIRGYEQFFKDKKEKIIKNLDSDKIRKIGWILLENINIFEEAFAEIFMLSPLLETPKQKPESYEEFLRNTSAEILEEILNKFLS